ncbi:MULTISPECIES: hypothetical protein [unclassified Cupriavidus]|uniref:hypothetical protein n=1 Tax=unclassified Cupriavidus TaxID=2640874 RepID=UPI001C000090|nr:MULTISPECIES: hypothetical protein [unclassified Cupriavidus]MCA3187904.1 hypothetical protein [Cupriavidus sp.]MCA3189451.1 hypothetical protein [Cupriavidus sp.]MCA3195531.1 hypothetical protein [Cupriavidus sp.]MCA3201086.1 hypothetical protein [Cupriavidus sp.]MCA3207900.1 hypothetical protein [Cupriavidus sp.]
MAEQKWVLEHEMDREAVVDLMGSYLKSEDEAEQWAASMLTEDEVLLASRGLALRLVRNAVGNGHQVTRLFSLVPNGWKRGDPMRVGIELADGTTVIFPDRGSK